MKLKASLLSVGVAAVCSLPITAAAQEPVWQIGTFDRSSAEFAGGSPERAVHFVIGQSDPAKDWYADAPAFFVARKPDSAAAPRAITFSLQGKPAQAYRLHVALLIEHSSQPALGVAVNGHEGMFYLHPKLDYSMGDTVAAFFPAYSHADVEAEIPGESLRAGENRITLQAVATAAKGVPDAGFAYDAVELDRVANAA
ncbi:MAG TPA: polysaccharide lyase family protein, partial [Acidobacteriaceae bacterium]